jgi:hypothetical protein
VERIVPEFIRRRFVIQKEKIKPNERTLNPFKKLSTIETGDLSSAAISKALNPDANLVLKKFFVCLHISWEEKITILISMYLYLYILLIVRHILPIQDLRP